MNAFIPVCTGTQFTAVRT